MKLSLRFHQRCDQLLSSCCLATKTKMTFCDADDKQSENLIAWSLPHTAGAPSASTSGVVSTLRSGGLGIFKTTIT